jgi:dihydroorotate dehydrogenase electron transfer subunit
MTNAGPGPVQVPGEVLSNKRAGRHQQLTLLAPGVAERFRPGTFLALAVGGALSERLLRRWVPISRVRATAAYRSTVELVFAATEPGLHWLAGLAPGAAVDVVGPLGRPFALPKEPVACTLVGVGSAAAALFSLAERLRKRGCAVHMVLGAASEKGLFGALEAKRAASTVVVTTEDGSVGIPGGVAQVLPELLRRTETDVVYAAGPDHVMHAVAAAAEDHGAWSQTALHAPLVCATGSCLTCVVPVVGEDGVPRTVRSCLEGPVFRGDRVRWADLETVRSTSPADLRDTAATAEAR